MADSQKRDVPPANKDRKGTSQGNVGGRSEEPSEPAVGASGSQPPSAAGDQIRGSLPRAPTDLTITY